MTEKRGIKHIVIQVIIQVVFTLVITYFAAQIVVPNTAVFVSTSISYNDKFVTTITINNYSNHEPIVNLDIYLNTTVDAENIISNVGYSYNYDNKYLRLNYIAPNQSESLTIQTKDAITSASISIAYSSKMLVRVLSTEQRMADYIITAILSFFGVSIVIYTVFAIFFNMYSKKQKNEIQALKEESATSKKQIKKANDRLKKNGERLKSLHHLYIARISAQSKELGFWKDTIRKLLYSAKDGKVNNDAIFDLVTRNLKTYQANSKLNVDEDDIEYLVAKKIHDEKLFKKE